MSIAYAELPCGGRRRLRHGVANLLAHANVNGAIEGRPVSAERHAALRKLWQRTTLRNIRDSRIDRKWSMRAPHVYRYAKEAVQ